MAHYYELSPTLAAQLDRMAAPNMQIAVTFKGRAKVLLSTGSFSTAYQDVTWDVSQLLAERPRISQTKPTTPTDDGLPIRASSVTVKLVNPTQTIATQQDGAIIDPAAIETGEFIIELIVGGVLQRVPIFRGRIEGEPTETRTYTEFTVIDTFWDTVSKPVKFAFGGFNQFSRTQPNGTVSHSYQLMQSTKGEFRLYDGITAWREEPILQVTINRTGGDTLDLRQISHAPKAPLGVYKMRFVTSKVFELSHPDGTTARGAVGSEFLGQYVGIAATNWIGTASEGMELEWRLMFTCEGNPVTIARYLIEQAFTDVWSAFGSPATIAPLPVVWSDFEAFEVRFREWRVFVSVGNSDNKSFENRSGSKPLNCVQVAQSVLSHCGCSLVIDGNGNIALRGPYLDDLPIHAVTSDRHITTHTISAVERFNYFIVQFGQNALDGNFAGKFGDIDLRVNSTLHTVETTLNLPYFKVGVSQIEVAELAAMYRRRYLDTQQQVTATVTPSMGAAAMAGDVYALEATERPIIAGNFEVVSISKAVKGEANLTLRRVQDAEGEPAKFCTGIFCDTKIF